MKIELRALLPTDPLIFEAAFSAQGWTKSAAQYERYLELQSSGARDVLVATVDGEFAGYLTIGWESHYAPFRAESIPEIIDFNVLQKFQRRGVGTALMDEAERRILTGSPIAGIGVGLTPDYGPAQILYVRRGYVPDGRGLSYDGRMLGWGAATVVDDSLVLHLTKHLVSWGDAKAVGRCRRMASMLKLAVFVGTRGRGSNLLAIHRATRDGRLDARVVLVVGSQEGAPALVRAREEGLCVAVIDPKAPGDGYEGALLDALREAEADGIALAGYLRRLPPGVVAAYKNRILNTHPALLPSFGGKGMYGHRVHEAVLAYGAKVSGCTVHFVDEEYDTGPVILQRAVPVEEGDTPETLAARILPEEHALFVEALQLLATGRLALDGRRVRIGQKLV